MVVATGADAGGRRGVYRDGRWHDLGSDRNAVVEIDFYGLVGLVGFARNQVES